jgi:hypothetical protein
MTRRSGSKFSFPCPFEENPIVEFQERPEVEVLLDHPALEGHPTALVGSIQEVAFP